MPQLWRTPTLYITHKTKRVIAGIDIGKESLDVSVNAGRVRRFSNTPSGIVKLLNWLRSEEVEVAVCERTGGYERKLDHTYTEPCQ